MLKTKSWTQKKALILLTQIVVAVENPLTAARDTTIQLSKQSARQNYQDIDCITLLVGNIYVLILGYSCFS
jgi:hypothetical protein